MVLYAFCMRNKSFEQYCRGNFIFLKAFNTESSFIKVWCTDQNYQPSELKMQQM